ncbi:MAG: sirohydrochlorin cobaltochelatase [Bacteroidaceae bacterium]|nr:sirohydrochlorin cobaltochelatase [Bacteroidaceae bacterium]
MKIKSLLIAMMAAAVSMVGFTSCSNDDDDSVNNYVLYQNAVDAQVKAQKAKSNHDKVILLVAFGSTWNQAFLAFDATKAAYEKAFPDCDVYVSYSSAICINRAAAGENTDDNGNIVKRNYYAPNFWLHAFATAQYKDITVQSLQVIPGEEYSRVINYIKDFANNHLGDLDDAYLQSLEGHLWLGTPLLNNAADVAEVARLLNEEYKTKAAEGVVAFMGHGNPDNYDTYKANIRYTQLQTALQGYSKNYFVGTVDMKDNYKQDVYARMLAEGITSGKINLYPLMSIAGDHANNDMAGQGEEYWDAEDEESEDNSWYEYFKHKGYTPEANLLGLLEVESIRNVWMNHTKNPIELEDYYHSMYPEE